MNDHITLKQLRKMIADIPSVLDDQVVWLGVDSGEGYVPLASVFSANSENLPLDGDEIHSERDSITIEELMDNLPKVPYKVWSEDGDDITEDFWSMHRNTEVVVALDVIVLGELDALINHKMQLAEEQANKDPEYLELEKKLKEMEEKDRQLRQSVEESDIAMEKLREKMERLVKRKLPKAEK